MPGEHRGRYRTDPAVSAQGQRVLHPDQSGVAATACPLAEFFNGVRVAHSSRISKPPSKQFLMGGIGMTVYGPSRCRESRSDDSPNAASRQGDLQLPGIRQNLLDGTRGLHARVIESTNAVHNGCAQ